MICKQSVFAESPKEERNQENIWYKIYFLQAIFNRQPKLKYYTY